MKKRILAICVLLLVCLFSCDIKALNKLLGKSREKFSEENTNEKNLNFLKGNQESREEKVNVVRIEQGLNKNKKDLHQKSIGLSQADALTNEQETYLVREEALANSLKSEIGVTLVNIHTLTDELDKSLLELENMQSDIESARFALNDAKSSSSNGISVNLKQSLEQAINNVKNSRDLAISVYKDKLHALSISKVSAKSAESFIDSALRESEEVRLNGYYYIGYIVDNISKAKSSLNSAKSMFNQVESDMVKLRNNMGQAKENFNTLNKAHKALRSSKK